MKRVCLNGCFDYLHAGHLFMLGMAYALAEGGPVIVGINCDAYLKNNKREDHQDSYIRRQSLLNTGIVDEVVIFKESSPTNFIQSSQPDIYLVGEEYRGRAVEEKILKDMRSEVVYVPRIGDWSTTSIKQEPKNVR